MSSIQIISAKEQTYPNLGRYFYVDLASGKHSVSIAVRPNGLQVIVQNASNRAWRGMGKSFADKAAALAAYKTPEIRAMIEKAVELAGAVPATATIH